MKNMGKILKVAAVSGCILFGMSAFAQEAANPAKPKNPLNIVFAEGGTNSGHSDGSDPLVEWCLDSSATLDEALSDANEAFDHRDFARAKLIFRKGLEAALNGQSNPTDSRDRSKSLTYKVLERGLEIIATMGRPISSDDEELQVRKLRDYYLFAEDVMKNLDPTYIANDFGRNQAFAENGDSQGRYFKYIRDQLHWFLGAMVYDCNPGNDYKHCSYGSDEAFFRLAGKVIGFALNDLRSVSFHDRFACVEMNLKHLQDKVNNYGDSESGPDYVLNKILYPKLMQYADQVGNGCAN